MIEQELLALIARGEDSRQQFEVDATNDDQLEAELAAFANSGGGQLFLGVRDDGTIAGLDTDMASRTVDIFTTTKLRQPLKRISLK